MDKGNLPKAYEPEEVEKKWYPIWESQGYFKAEPESNKPPYTIVIPPPNVTGSLHMGHALTVTIQDALIRWRRMCGYNTLWLPGSDHAGIATQMVVERHLAQTEQVTRHDLGREEFLKRVWLWKEQYGDRIKEQLKVMGCSLHWDMERFTMDPGMSRAVREVFVRLYEEGLIYRAERLINWCPRCSTALSDLEVNHEENVKGSMWDFAYPIEGGGELTVSTTRPETMLGDTAVAVHPDDKRYQHLIGKEIRHPFVDRTFPVIGDPILVDPEFGTGAVKVTPAHDFNDFETGARHQLPMVNILNKDGTLNENGGPFQGLTVKEAREAVVKALEDKGLFRGKKDHQLSLGNCQRCECTVEPLLSMQWFVKAEPLAAPAIDAVRSGRTKITPEQYERVYFHWMENIRDWCISRQLWWGHRIPAWTCAGCDEIMVARETPDRCTRCGGQELKQDEDVLDTWFSSALWPFSTLGWPEETPELKTFYPTSVLETGFDILFFWVARMMMMGIHFMGEEPFADVYLHGMVRDSQGHKMSKTRGNVIDPLEVTGQYGADALRFTLATLAAPGRDLKLDLDWVAGYRNFCNKIWNAARFAIPHLAPLKEQPAHPTPGTLADRWILSRLARTVDSVNTAMEEFRLNDGASIIYQFFWHEFCDWYLELIKPILYDKTDDSPQALETQTHTRETLAWVLDSALRLLHPFMCHITEEIWQQLPKRSTEKGVNSIMVARFPAGGDPSDEEPRPQFIDQASEEAMELIMGTISAVRTIRAESNVPTSLRPKAVVICTDREAARILEEENLYITDLARLEKLDVQFNDGKITPPQGAVKAVVNATVEVWLPLLGLIDLEAEDSRLRREHARTTTELERTRGKLKNEKFTSRAPAEVVARERAKLEELQGKKEKLEHGLELIGELKQQEQAPGAGGETNHQ